MPPVGYNLPGVANVNILGNLKLATAIAIKLCPSISSAVLFHTMVQLKGSAVIWGCSRTSPTPEETHVETRENAQRRKYFNCVQFLRLGICTSLVLSNCLSLTIYCL